MYTIWWWQFGCRDEWTSKQIITVSSDVNMRSMHEEEVSNKCVGSLWLKNNPDCDVMLLITLSSKVDLSW